MIMEIQSTPFQAENIASKADVETLDSYESNLNYYTEQNFSFIPIPKENQYFDIDNENLKDLKDSQFIDSEAHLMKAIRKFAMEEFLLIDLEPEYYLVDLKDPHIRGVYDTRPEKGLPADAELFTPDEVRMEFPEIAEMELRAYDERYMIITLADLNKRRVREMLYVVIGGLSSELSSRIEIQHPDSRKLFKYLRPGTIGKWEKENLKDMNLHIAEHMNLLGMMQVIQGSDSEFVKACGFESKNDVTTLNKINDIRNRVMHPNRSLVYNRQDVSKVIEAVDEAQRILGNMAK